MRRWAMAGMLCAVATWAQVGLGKDIVDTAVGAGQFKTLVAAVKAAGLVETLKGDGPFTVFAPTDEAFAKLPAGTIESLLKPESKDKLIAILTYHVVPGKVLASSVLPVGSAKTVQGSDVALGLTVGGANVIKTDIECSNGVIHVIDAVMLPKEEGKQSSATPRTMIERAIAEGSAMYNHGDKQGCATLYQSAMHELIGNHGNVLPATTLVTLRTAVREAGETTCADSQAWILRRGLDSAYAGMSPRP